MIAIRHKKTGKWLMVNECDEYELTDELIPLLNPTGTNDEILQDIQDYSDDEFEAKDLEVVPLTILTHEQDHLTEPGKMIDQQWISIKEKLPINGWYLTFDGDSVDNMLFKDGRWIAKTGRYDKNGVFTRDDMTEYITHWMNLPDKPKEE